ncbi:MAG: Asp-tRNA(Asn)/Glu-tRNA(Gln) amidotransferase subunit GatC [Candidatus Nomurabacteria bacterium]|jgi:aspartyl-tRNA(Asn)/glutamyl-tRNA(Gln) amidotransferase subunit C|nr:Asp-tRNA(Asn)/Glu-tRNA(Gln) amidotransferase subunit GatC [Candidatus Nomurabacteria bacterium]
MSITKAEIIHLGKLSNISLNDQQLTNLNQDLENIISYISQLDELNTEGVEPTYQCFDMANVWREDEITEFEANREDLLALSADTANHQIKVPKVL